MDLSDRLERIISEETTIGSEMKVEVESELMCKVGDVLYIPVIDEDANKAYIEECPVNDISTKRIFISLKDPPGDDCDDNYLIDELGKTIFLSKEAAEEALKEREQG